MKDTNAIGTPVIEAKGLGLTFETNDGPVHALKDVNLTVGKGEFVSFIGPSGCGKTTFLRVIADLDLRSVALPATGVDRRHAADDLPEQVVQ